MGRLLLSVVGAAAGFIIGGPVGARIGFALGGLLGSILFPPETPNVEGPRLDDLSVQTSTYGVPIPWVWGDVRVSGNVTWAIEIEEEATTTSSGGKGGGGGGSQTTYAYFIHGEVGICKYTPWINNIYRIWADKKLIFDRGAIEPTKYQDYIDATRLGQETQLPNSYVEGYEGVGNVPGMRGIVSATLMRLPIADFSNHFPQFEFELNGPGPLSRGGWYEHQALTDEEVNHTGGEYAGEGDTLSLVTSDMWLNPNNPTFIGRGFGGNDEFTTNDLYLYRFERTGPISNRHPFGEFERADIRETVQSVIKAEDDIGERIFHNYYRDEWFRLAVQKLAANESESKIIRRFDPSTLQDSAPLYILSHRYVGTYLCGYDLFGNPEGSEGHMQQGFTQDHLLIVRFIPAAGNLYEFHRFDGINGAGKSIEQWPRSYFWPGGTEWRNWNDEFVGDKDGHFWAWGQIPLGVVGTGPWFRIYRYTPGEIRGPTGGLVTDFTPWDHPSIDLGRDEVDPFMNAGDTFPASNENTKVGMGTYYDYDNHRIYLYGPHASETVTITGHDGGTTAGRTKGVLVCFDIDSGRTLWVNDTELSFQDHKKPSFVQNGILWGFMQGPGVTNYEALYSIDGATGAIINTYFFLDWPENSGVRNSPSDNPWVPVTYDPRHKLIIGGGGVEGGAGVFGAQIVSGPDYTPFYIGEYDPEALASPDLSLTLADIVDDICDACDLPGDERDTEGLRPVIPPGYVVSTQTTGRKAIEPLQQVYDFDGVEIDRKMVFNLRHGNPILAAIVDGDLGAHESGVSTDVVKLTEPRKQDDQLSRTVILQYFDQDINLQVSAQQAQRHTDVIPMDNELKIGVPITMTATQAKLLAEKSLFNIWVMRNTYQFALPPTFLYLTPGDSVTVTKDGKTFTVYLTKVSTGGNNVIECEGVALDELVYLDSTTTGDTSDGFVDPSVPPVPPDTKIVFLDCPLLREEDDAMGFYSGAYALEDGWTSGLLFQSLDGGSNYNRLTTYLTPVTTGVTLTVLPFTTNFHTFQAGATLTVRLAGAHSPTLASVTLGEALAGANAAMVGSELIVFQTATLVPGTTTDYELSNILRGQRGTDWAMYDHAGQETFTLLQEGTISDAEMSLLYKDQALQYKGVTSGAAVDDAAAYAFTNTGVRLLPLSPVNLAATKDAVTGDWTLTWDRRSRYGNDIFGWPPLDDGRERYYVDIYQGAAIVNDLFVGGTLIATHLVEDEPTLLYTSAMQVTDLGADAQAIQWCVTQLSSRVGRGYARCTESTNETASAGVIPVLQGTLSLTTTVPTIGYDEDPTPGPVRVNLIITTTAPGVNESVGTAGPAFEVPVYDFTLSTTAPTVGIDHPMNPAAINFTIEGQAPTSAGGI